MVREALRSVESQTHRDFQLIVVDDSDAFDIEAVMKEFKFPDSLTIHHKIRRSGAATVNRLGVNINSAYPFVEGDAVAYLADDDGYFPTWFEKVSEHFEKHPDHVVGYGILKFCLNQLDFAEHGEFRFPNEVVTAPGGVLDHNQVVHRRLNPPVKWPETLGSESNSDFWFFSQVATKHPFYPINAWAACKRLHDKNLQGSVPLYQSGGMAGMLRE
jgi:glycosyltransferase involved in cell wall biosynthesis